MYTLYLDIERSNDMKHETKSVDKAESLVFYTRNQFSRELRNMFELDEAKTLKYQIITIAKKVDDHYTIMMANGEKLQSDLGKIEQGVKIEDEEEEDDVNSEKLGTEHDDYDPKFDIDEELQFNDDIEAN